MRTKLSGLGLTVLASIVTLSGAALRADENVYRSLLPSVVWILTPAGEDKVAMGTGALIDVSQRLAITALHVVDTSDVVVVFFPELGANGRPINERKNYLENIASKGIRARVVVKMKDKDLALLQLESLPANAKALPLAAESVEPGQTLHAIGNSGKEDMALWRYRCGTVRQVYLRTCSVEGISLEARMVEAQLPTNHGDSGGPMVNDKGELVAVTSFRNESESLVDYGIDISEIEALSFNGKRLRDVVAPATAATPPVAKWDPYSLIADPSSNGPSPFGGANGNGFGAPANPAIPAWKPWSPPVAPAPAFVAPEARIVDVRTQHGVFRDGQKGVEFEVDLDVDGMRNVPCEITVIVCDEARGAIRAVERGYSTAAGHLASFVKVVPLYDTTRMTKAVLFLPYAQIDAATPAGAMSFNLAFDVWSPSTSSWLGEPPRWETMRRLPPRR